MRPALVDPAEARLLRQLERARVLERRGRPTQDDLRVTEEGAVAIALALSARHCRWRVVRCLQARLGEGADWLMVDASKRRVVLEVAGTDEGNLRALQSAKMEQARSSIFARAPGVGDTER
jgi:hypothetical protein